MSNRLAHWVVVKIKCANISKDLDLHMVYYIALHRNVILLLTFFFALFTNVKPFLSCGPYKIR